jgi:hypothetical protein
MPQKLGLATAIAGIPPHSLSDLTVITMNKQIVYCDVFEALGQVLHFDE